MVTVLKSGGDFDHGWVYAMESMAWANIDEPHLFTCLTDLDPGGFQSEFVELIKLREGWPGWWSKMELFRPGQFDQGDTILYLDLDTIIARNVGHLEGGIDCDLILLRDFYRPATHMATGMMGWTAGEFEDLFHAFNVDPEKWMGRCRSDQEFIQQVIDPGRVRFWQDEYPEQIVSYKVHALRGLPSQAHVVCFHGKPRPSEVQDKWVRDRYPLRHG